MRIRVIREIAAKSEDSDVKGERQEGGEELEAPLRQWGEGRVCFGYAICPGI